MASLPEILIFLDEAPVVRVIPLALIEGMGLRMVIPAVEFDLAASLRHRPLLSQGKKPRANASTTMPLRHNQCCDPTECMAVQERYDVYPKQTDSMIIHQSEEDAI